MNQLPTRQQILDWIADNPDATAKRDIAKAFNIKGAARIELKRMLKELESEGLLGRRRGSVCVTARGNCMTRPAPFNAPCGCEVPGFGFKRGAIGG